MPHTEAFADNINSRAEGVAYMKAKFGVHMSNAKWSATRSQIKTQEKKGGAMKAVKATVVRESATEAEPKASPAVDMIDDLAADKDLVENWAGLRLEKSLVSANDAPVGFDHLARRGGITARQPCESVEGGATYRVTDHRAGEGVVQSNGERVDEVTASLSRLGNCATQ
jgi:hypothetical protein